MYIQYTNPAAYPPLDHSSLVLARNGWSVLFLGVRDVPDDIRRLSSHPNIAVRAIGGTGPGLLQKLNYGWFLTWVLVSALRWRPSWLYASDLLSCPTALVTSALLRTNVLYHEHDSPPGSSASAFLRLCLRARRALARRARICVLPSQERATSFSEEMELDGAVHWVWNCPSREEVEGPRAPNCDGHLRVLYHGSIVPSRLPESVIESLPLLAPSISLRIVGYETIGSGNYVQRLRTVAEELGVAARLEVMGTVPGRDALLALCRGCDVGLALMPLRSHDVNERTMAGASNKPFDYLACGLPVVVSDLPEWRRLFVDPGYGLACDPGDPRSIAAAIAWFADHRADMRTMGERGRQRALSEWNYEAQFATVYRQLCAI